MSARNIGVRKRLSAKWREDSLCLKRTAQDPTTGFVWLTPDSGLYDLAREICKECPVALACLEDALTDPDSEGIRAGAYFHSGKVDAESFRYIRENFPEIDSSRIKKKYADRTNEESDEAL